MNKSMNRSAEQKKRNLHHRFVLIVLSILIVVAFIISMNTGLVRLSPVEVIQTLFGFGTEKQSLVLFEFRLPRIILAVLVGMSLAISGCILQSISGNSLADPGILGINAGAGLTVVLFISLFPGNVATSVYLLPILAFGGAGITAFLIYILAYKRHEGISPTRLLLTGVAVSAGISAAMIVLTLRLNPDKYQFVATWLAGSIWGSNWAFVLSLLPWLLILIPFVFSKAQVLNVLSLGDSMATGLGTTIERERGFLLVAAVGLAGASVSVSGGIGFVGLIGPHLARQLVGSRHQFLIPTSALVGGLLVIVADAIGRWILQPSEIPTGIVVAVIGAPYFLYLLSRSKA